MRAKGFRLPESRHPRQLCDGPAGWTGSRLLAGGRREEADADSLQSPVLPDEARPVNRSGCDQSLRSFAPRIVPASSANRGSRASDRSRFSIGR